jgi:hypothetical protein
VHQDKDAVAALEAQLAEFPRQPVGPLVEFIELYSKSSATTATRLG